jgi:FKBP-type peptidyl-prolyl cis-trans isomerase (trigger factor)
MEKNPGTFGALATSFALKRLPESQIELSGDIPAEVIAPYRTRALKEIAKQVDLPGFRKGKVPADMALKKIGEVAVLEEAVEHFMRDFYPALASAHKADVVGRPEIRITKLAPGNPVSLVIQVVVYPEVHIPKDWKGVAEKIPLEAYTGELPKMKVPPSPEEEQKARDYMARDQRRGKIINALLEKVAVEIPKIFIESELEKIISQLKEDVARFGVTYEAYLRQINKTEEVLRGEFRDQATKRAKLQLTLNKIAQDEHVEADGGAVAREIKHALEHFPKASPDLLQIHIETVLKNEKVLQLLESGEKKE